MLTGAGFFCCGCNIFGWATAPTRHEQKVPAQFRLKDVQERNIVVVVDLAYASRVPPSVRQELVHLINGHLVQRAGLNKRYLVAAADSPERAKIDELQEESPEQIGRLVKAGLVLFVRLEDYREDPMSHPGFLSASVTSRAMLIDTESGRTLWPMNSETHLTRVKVEAEIKGRENALERLAKATSHCIVRNLYDCPRDTYKIAEEQSDVPTEVW
ncbi:MAG: hypothetical protein JW828_00225 [Sedimentisphaerales bacterium]|nr:hypothetical protein [Sedimentisphaerales bacterium]